MLSLRHPLAILGLSFVASRVFYYLLGVRFNASPLGFYLQYIDPELLQGAFWQSLLYLKEQPPGYNFALGSVLHLCPGHSEVAFHAGHLLLGFAMEWALFSLLIRMGARRTIALTVAIVFAVNPVTVLYENWLFYAYPLTALLIFAALFLHRYVSAGRIVDGGAFFLCLAILGTVRTVYHPAWFGLTALFLVWVLPSWRRRTVVAAVGPALLLGGIYLKHLLLFGGLVPGGEVFQSTNLAMMATADLPPRALRDLEASGGISPILRIPVYSNALAYSALIPEPAKTGIAVLDTPVKSTGAPNWNCLWMGKVGHQYKKDALVVLQEHPGSYGRQVLRNLGLYFKAAHWGWPYDGTSHPNSRHLAAALQTFSWFTTGTAVAEGTPWLSYLWIAGLLAFGMWQIGRRLWRGRGKPATAPDATGMTLLFVVFNILFAAGVTIVFSAADHNRYRNEVSGLFAVLLGLLLTAVVQAQAAPAAVVGRRRSRERRRR